MSVFDEINLEDFIEQLTNKTKNNEVDWKRVNKVFYSKLIDRSVTYSSIKDPFYITNDKLKSNVVIGKIEKKVYYEEDQYYFEDEFFITFTESDYTNPTTFLESEGKNSIQYSFSVALSKLHRLIQINHNDIKGKINNWFD
jgi:hypothetical protein